MRVANRVDNYLRQQCDDVMASEGATIRLDHLCRIREHVARILAVDSEDER